MFRELIENEAENNKYIKPQKGASPAEIKSAEKKLRISFPNELKTLLTEMNGDKYLFFSAEEIAERNTEVRDILGECYEDLDKLLFFACNGCGDYYSYVISDGSIKETEIIRWEHETNERIPVANSLTEVIEKYFSDKI